MDAFLQESVGHQKVQQCNALSLVKKTSRIELTKCKLFTEHATHIFDWALLECLSHILSGYLWKGTSPNPQEVQQIAATGWMEMQSHASRLIWANFTESFMIMQETGQG